MIALKPSKEVIENLICMVFLIFIVAIMFAYKFGFICFCVFVLTVLLVLVPYTVSVGRTIILRESGCEIKIGPYSKSYAWEDFSTIRMESSWFAIRLPYHNGGMFFSARRMRKPTWFDPMMYSFLHPIASFTVFFSSNENQTKRGTPGFYEYDKHELMQRLDQWGVKY